MGTQVMEDKGIFFSWNGKPCACRCDHCLLASETHPSRVSYGDAKGIIEQFLLWRHGSARTGFSIGFAAGFSVDFPELPDYIRFRVQNGMQGADSLQVGGIRMRSGADLRLFIESLAQAGIRRIGLSFHGANGSHDRCTCRPGDYEFLKELARTAAECGLTRFETVFLRRSTLGELPALLAQLDAIPALESRHVGPFDYRGRAKLLEADRPTSSDIQTLPDTSLRCLDLETLKPESERVRHIVSHDTPEKTRRYYLMPICEDTILRLQTERPDDLLARMRETDTAFRNHVPPLRELATLFGNMDGERLYALRDLEWKWTDAFLAEHPGIDATGVFDDHKPCVLYK